MSSVKDNAWQDNTFNTEEALRHAYRHSVYSDVTIQTTDAKGSSMCFSAHKIILATRSPLFADMLYDKVQNSHIISLNISPRAMDVLLWYLYSDSIEVDCIEELLESFEVALKYKIGGFSESCVKKLLQMSSSLSSSNVYSVLEIAELSKSEELQSKCFQFIRQEPEKVLLSEEFLSTSEETLCKTLKELDTNLHAKTALKAVIRWMTKNNSSDRKFLSTIDFALFSADDFLNIEEEFPDFFSKEEKRCLLPNLLIPESSELPSWCRFSKTRERCIKMTLSSPYEVMEIIRKNSVKVQTDCSQKFSKLSFLSLTGFQQELLLKICVQSREMHLVMMELAFGSDYVPVENLKVDLRRNTGTGGRMQAVKHYLLASRGHYSLLPCNKTVPESRNNFNLLLSVEASGLSEYGPTGPVSDQKYRAALVSNCDSINLKTHSNVMVPSISLKPFADWVLLVDPKDGEKTFIVSAMYFDTLKNAQKYLSYLEKGLNT